MILADHCICMTEADAACQICSRMIRNMRQYAGGAIDGMSQSGCTSDVQTFMAEACDFLAEAKLCFDIASSLATTEIQRMHAELDETEGPE